MRLFSFSWRKHLATPAVCCLFAASAWTLDAYSQDSQFAAEKAEAEAEHSSSWDREKSESRNIRLNYVSTPWSKVLNDLAEKSGSTLIMHDVPPGKYSRRDWSRHARKEAVQILNRELEPKGFRIHVKNEYLTVMQSRRSRPEYQRPVAPRPEEPRPVTPRPVTPRPVTPRPVTPRPVTPRPVEPRQIPEVAQQMPARPVGQWVSPPENVPARPVQTLNTRVQRPDTFARGTSLIQRAGFEEEQSQSAPAEVGTLAISPKNRPALDIAKQIHKAFKSRSQLENAGPNGLPAFIVSHAMEDDNAGETQFTVEIDTAGNRLLITATENVQQGLKLLVQRIDVNPLTGKELPTLVSGNGSTAQIGKQLQQPLRMISQARQRSEILGTGPGGQQHANPLAEGPMLAQAEGQPQPGTPNAAPSENQNPMPAAPGSGGISSDLVGNLKGDVTIEALDDLDLLILRGNAGDVNAVMEVIQRIEQLALGSLPEIHLLKLQNVDSQSLAQLMNDVYEQLSELRSDNAQQKAASVNVVPVVTPNAILILAPSNTMEAILQLAEELDQPVDPSHEVEVFRLRHAIASSVVTILEGFYEEQVGLGTRLKVAADARTNSVVVQARPRDLSEIASVIKKIDADEAASVNQMKIFKLKSALADELAEFLNSAIQSVSDPRASTVGQTQTGQGQQQQTDPKSVVLEFLAEDGQQLARSGLLSDIRFNAETRTNSLAVTAPAQSMPLIQELILLLDRPSSAVADVKYFRLKNADALDAVEMLTSLFEENTNNNNNNNESSSGIQLVGATDTSSSLLPLKFVADARTNSVVATGGADALIIVENLLYRLDATDPRTRTTKVIKLINAPAADVADAINVFLQSQRDLATIDPTRVSTSQLLEQEVIVTPEAISNNLLISATPKYFEEIEALAKQLDAEPAQVVIQALLVEVALDNNDEFGVELGFQDPILFERSVIDNLLTITETIFDNQGNPTSTATRIVSQEATPGFNYNNQPLGGNNGPLAQPAHVGTQGLSSFSLGRTNSDLGYGGLVLSASSDSVNVLIRALAARRSVRILSRPQIQALDNQLAQIQVGQIVPVTDGITQTQTTVSPQILRDPAGIILTVTPRISPEGQIVMEVVAEKSKYTDEGVEIYTDVTTGTVITAPVKDISTAQTTVKVQDGQTIVLGGMITDTEDVLERKVPWLGDLPFIGQAFRFDSQATQRTELLIFLTPRVIHNGSVSEHIKQVEANRIHFFQEEAEEIHGPLMGVPFETGEYIDSQEYQGAPLDFAPGEIIVPQAIDPAAPPAPAPPAVDLETSSETNGVYRLNTIKNLQ
ncbi:Putative type II secretion system protein D precursor [Thalassoglobus polymorphus]|uniref:Type II secretion system protein D n=2 Tax=Thalassoglobus polymorphus TaxID=2527994 RepID=A0A517QGX1_9PLAN|nr:Putative type II secretion system protein D precursor [Thalassoglobus polymorphus]